MSSSSIVRAIHTSLHSSPLLLPTIILAVCGVLALHTRRAVPNKDIPLFVPEESSVGGERKRWTWDSPNLRQEAYKKFPGKPFRIWTTEGQQVVIPPDFVDEVKMLPDHTFPSALLSFFLHKYLWNVDPIKLDPGYAVIKDDMNKTMSKIFPEVRDEVNIILPLQFPDSNDWHPIKVYPKILRLVNEVNAKIFVGSELHQNEEWIDITSNYTRYIFVSSAKLRVFPPWLRPFVQYFVPELRKGWQCIRVGQRLLAPILAERKVLDGQSDAKKPNDPIEWMRNHMAQSDKNDTYLHSLSQLNFAALSANTTSQTLTNCIFNLATYPEYLPILREEVNKVLTEYRGKWSLESMAKLKKLDSFIKETLRHSATFQRLARQPITLSDGTHIASGTQTFSATNAINFDPFIYPSPTTFDGLRFYKLRQASPTEERKHQLTSVTKTELQFGSGRHACSGRWFASHEMKLVFTGLVSKFEVKLKEGEERPKSILYQTNQLPDPKVEILFKNRK